MMMLGMMVVMVNVTSDVAPQSLLLGAPVLEPDLDDAHVEPGLSAEPLAHLSRRLDAGRVGALQRVQLMAADGRARSLAADHVTAAVRTAICTRSCASRPSF